MKRVHGWEESDDSPSSGSPPAVSHKSAPAVRKRKGTPPVASVPMKRQSSSQTKARAASISYFQNSQQREHTVDQTYPVTRKWPEPGAPGYGTTFQNNLIPVSNAQHLQSTVYPQQFRHSQDYYPHDIRYTF
jgi:hypothetical protein